ncbi:AmmeMemoRadiSam system protein B [candidate division KSB1 bacterium]|nr:MAG: AmmeMemoRadiSam system protein B [candidate division KSB1 bacterium]
MEKIRESAIAGSWYPGDKNELKNLLDSYWGKVKKHEIKEKVLGLISPHAGYIYSGTTAVAAYNQIRNSDIKTVVVLSPMHRIAIARYMTNAENFYRTPLGLVPVDHEKIDKMRKLVDITYIAGDEEHSLEIQLPFLQYALKEFSILPVLVGHGDVYDVTDMVDAICEVCDKESTLLVASSDMHHIDDYTQVEERDKRFIEALRKFDIEKIREILSSSDTTICGKVPISIMLDVAVKWGAGKAVILKHTHSSEITGRKIIGEYTVGYLAAAITE